MRSSSWSRPLALVVAATALLGGLTACGGSDSKADEPAGKTPSSSSSTSPTGSPSESAASGKTQLVRLKAYGMSFELPAGWTKLGADGVLTADNPVVKDFAKKLGKSPDAVVTMMTSTVKMMAVSDKGMVKGFLENVNAVAIPAKSVTIEQLKVQLLSIGSKITGTTESDSAFGKVQRVSYTLETNGQTLNGCALAVETGDDVVVITASAHSHDEAESRIDQVQASLAKI